MTNFVYKTYSRVALVIDLWDQIGRPLGMAELPKRRGRDLLSASNTNTTSAERPAVRLDYVVVYIHSIDGDMQLVFIITPSQH